MGVSILRLPQVKAKTGLGRSTIYNLIAEGAFPKQIKISARSSGWLSSEVEEWINSRVEQRDEVA